MTRFAWLVVGFLLVVPAPRALAQAADLVTVGSPSALPGAAVDGPGFIRDLSGTPLGIDQPPGSRIQSYSLTVTYAAAAVQSITFARAGITLPLTPSFESSPAAPGTISLLDTFAESTNLSPFTLNAPAPGNQVAVLHVVVAPTAAPGSTIILTLDPTLTQLTDQGGQLRESGALGTLGLVNGSITVQQPAAPASIPASSGWALAALAAALAALGWRRRSAR
jgi:hypothetical protein